MISELRNSAAFAADAVHDLDRAFIDAGMPLVSDCVYVKRVAWEIAEQATAIALEADKLHAHYAGRKSSGPFEPRCCCGRGISDCSWRADSCGCVPE